ncbi:DUF4139 domain-containing protein [Aminivibrio sp.]|uniref:DUF4139 domain-containing protein n=1 Tax=Aminivibrio sp. TaxID=1872489 RepID=UPI001A61E48D|nr:DUF4139 domain-containing protein [Aminivibrio sp.]MBL3538456.1 mucoidy inhibitor MuiA family protein [Aminivibrio sp.]MDK2959381.1 hypothetical protein [Synergistaceae bacterium]
MKFACTVLATYAMVLFGFAGFGSAEPILPDVAKVDLYPRGARVLFSVPVAPHVNFDLPGSFDPSTVRPLPADGQKIMSFEATGVPRPGWIPEALRDLHAQIKENEKKLAVLTGRTSAIKQSFELLSGPLPKDLKGSDMPEYVDAARKTRENLETELIAVSAEMDETKKILDALTADFSSRMPPNSDTAVRISARVEGGDQLFVEAWTQQAGWNPFYRMNLDTPSGAIHSSLLAGARQHTGIVLEGDLFFHTAVPSTTVAPPDLPPLVADFAAKKVRRSDVMKEMAEISSRANFELAVPAPAAPPEILTAMTDMTTMAKGTLPGDNRQAEFLLGEFDLKSDVSIVSVPVLSEEAWITAETKKLPTPLLPGPAELSVDGRLSAKTRLAEQGAGTDLLLAFGKMPLVKAVREKMVSKEGSTWTGKGRLEDGYFIEITNGLEKKISVVLKDRIPVSAREKISVETIKIEPKPDEQDKESILSWKLSLAPGEKKRVEVLFRISFPAEETVVFR